MPSREPSRALRTCKHLRLLLRELVVGERAGLVEAGEPLELACASVAAVEAAELRAQGDARCDLRLERVLPLRLPDERLGGDRQRNGRDEHLRDAAGLDGRLPPEEQQEEEGDDAEGPVAVADERREGAAPAAAGAGLAGEPDADERDDADAEERPAAVGQQAGE